MLEIKAQGLKYVRQEFHSQLCQFLHIFKLFALGNRNFKCASKMYAYMAYSVAACMFGDQSWHWVSSSIALHLVLWCLSLNVELAVWLHWLDSELLRSACLHPVLQLQICDTVSGVYTGAWEQNSCSHAKAMNSLPIEPSSWSHIKLFIKF